MPPLDTKNFDLAVSLIKTLVTLVTGSKVLSRDITDEELSEAMTDYDQAKKKLADLEKKVSGADDGDSRDNK